MTIWEKAVVNMQKGAQKINAAASVFSERVKAELAIVRLRIRIDEVQEHIDEQHRAIGRKIVELHRKGALPKESEQLFTDEDTATIMNELAAAEKEIEDLKNEIKNGREALRPDAKRSEDTGL
jgi:predicted  nucleic acid-binding Zn-ribbon protein